MRNAAAHARAKTSASHGNGQHQDTSSLPMQESLDVSHSAVFDSIPCWTRCLSCHFTTFGALTASHQTNQRRHKRNRPLTRDILRNQLKNIVVQACCGHISLFLTFSKNSTICPHISFVTSKSTLGWKPSHLSPVFAFYNSRYLFQTTLL